MKLFDDSIKAGHFARKQILSSAWLISWSHRGRFNLGLRLAQEFAGKRLLDYGCGDGTFLALLMAQPGAPASATGAELLPETVNDCKARVGARNLDFVGLDQLDGDEHRGLYDAVICMEVLEHMVDVPAVLDRFARLLTPAGKLLISVPVETGIPLVIKQAARRVAGWRGIGDYPGTSPYTFREYCAGLFAGPALSLARPVHRDADGRATHDHKGFNWMALRRQLCERFVIERTLGSPITWLTPHLASQVWFIASRKPAGSASILPATCIPN
jgi:SAM-dependent methyltransferase